MKVTKLHIDDYKVFKDFDIDFTDGNGNAQNLIVLAGINGTGKTTLLEFFLENDLLKSYSDSEGLIPYILLKNVTIGNTENKKAVIESPPKGSAYLTVIDSEDRSRRSEHFLLRDHFFYFSLNKREAFNDFREIQSSGGAIGYRERDKIKKNDRNLSLYTSEEYTIINYIKRCILEENMLAFDAYKRLQSFIDTILEGFKFEIEFSKLDYQEKPFFKSKNKDDLTITELSSGEREILFLVLNLFIAKIRDSIILIDEPEFSLHPSWQNKIAGVLQKYADEYNCQVILATHSPQIIGSVKPEQLRLLTKDENGAIKVVEHTPNAYGLTFDRILREVMGVTEQRTPEIENRLSALSNCIKRNEFDSPEFTALMKEVEDLIGYSDRDLVLMRFEIAKRRKQRAADN